MKRITFRCHRVAPALSVLSIALLCVFAPTHQARQGASSDRWVLTVQQFRQPVIAIARTEGVDGDPQVFQEKIADRLKGGSATVYKVNGADPTAEAKANECDYLLITKLRVNGKPIPLGKLINKSHEGAKILDQARLPKWMRKGKVIIQDTERTADLARGLKNVLSIKPRDKVTFTHSLVAVATQSEVTQGAFNEPAESEEQVVDKVVTQVVQNVLVNTRNGRGANKTEASRFIPRESQPEEPKASSSDVGGSSNTVGSSKPVCTASIDVLPMIRGLRLGMTEAEVRKLIPPTSRLKASGGSTSNSDGVAEITITPQQTLRPENFSGYKSMDFKLIEGKVAHLSIHYADDAMSGDVKEFASLTAERLKLPTAWEFDQTDATMKCQGVEISLSATSKTITLTDVDTFERKKKSKYKL